MVRVLAFFDTGYQTALPAVPRVSRLHAPLNWPASRYDLGEPKQAALVVAMAVQAGLDGFVVDLHAKDGGFATGAGPLTPFCAPGRFGVAYRWPAAMDLASLGAPEMADALVATLSSEMSLLVDGRPMLIVEQREYTALTPLRDAAAKVGLPGLYVIATQVAASGLATLGYDAALDPDPPSWASCAPKIKPTGFDMLEIAAGLRDSVEVTDRFYLYAPFVVGRMVEREKRGKMFPRVFPSYQNWPLWSEGGATLLVNDDGGGTVDRLIYGQFIENAMIFAQENFMPSERLVFLDSWNNWLAGSSIEPSVLDGDLVYNTTRNAIDRGRYMIRTRGEKPQQRLDPALHGGVAQLCEAASAYLAPTLKP